MSAIEKWRRFAELPPDIQARLQNLPELLAREGVLLAYLFGSLASQETGHDVDLALLMPETKKAYRLQATIEAFLGIERLDIVDLRRATPVMRMEVLVTGRCLYALDEGLRVDHEIAWLREYKDTAWLRRHQQELLKEKLERWSSEQALRDKGVIGSELYQRLQGLGGFRNILVHLYQKVDLEQLWDGYQRGLVTFPEYSRQILAWLEQQAE